MSDEDLRIEVEALLAGSVRRLSPGLSALHEARLGPDRRHRLSIAMLVSAIGTAGALVFELLDAHDQFRLALVARMALCMITLIGALAITRARRVWQEVLIYGVSAVTLAVLNGWLGEKVPGAYGDRYMLATLFILAALCAVPPVSMLFAGSVGVAGLCGLTAVMVWVPGGLPLSGNADILLFGAGAIGVAMLLARRKDTALRRGFLHALRDEMTTRELGRMNAELTRLTNTDALTGIDNRRKFEADLGRAWAARDQAGQAAGLGVLIVDVDHFKQFNDSAGHAAGDSCLRSVASAIAGCMRGSDLTVARYGGEEFAVLASFIARTDLPALGERVRRAVETLATPHPGRPGRLLTISVGAAWCEAASCLASQDDLLRAADQALYAAKIAGRNRVVLDGDWAEPERLAS